MILTMIQHGILLEKNLNFSSKAARHSGSKWYIVPPPPPPPNFLKYADNYCVTAKKLILNVSKIRLRLIFSCALYLPRLFHKRIVTKKQTEKLFSKIISGREPEILNNNKFVQQIKTTNLQLINIQGGIFINRHGCRRFQACKSFANAKL